MSERLEEIKERYMEHEYDYALSAMDINWLIEQAERVQELEIYVDENSKKHANLNVFLQDRDTTSTLGMHVIDAVMKYAQELEVFMNKADESLVKSGKQIMKLTDEKAELEYQNKRYREALDKQFKEFWDACVAVVGEDAAYDIVAEMPEEESE